jgi:glycosyltransferase involved in cell wall biosynthesis
MKLSILIPTLPERDHQLMILVNRLKIQNKYQDVQVVWKSSGREVPTGRKRNQLIDETQSDYFIFIDDDDQVPEYYIDELIQAISQRPDVVTFVGYMTTNGINRRDFTIKLGSKYEERNGHYYRFPNHLCAFRREAVKGIRFPDKWEQEDYEWAKLIHDRRLIKSEVHINKPMYHYDFKTKAKPLKRR